MPKPTFSHHLQSEYISAQHLNLLPFELFNHVQAGRLNPLDEYTGQAIPRPDVLRMKKKMEKILYAFKHSTLTPIQLGNVLTKLDGTIERARLKKKHQIPVTKVEKQILCARQEYFRLEDKLKAITDIFDWTTYDLPENTILAQKDLNLLLNSYFHKDEVRKIGFNVETPLPAQEEPGSMPPKAPAPIEESAPAPVNEVVFSYMSPTEVMVKCGNKRAASYDQISLGFKKVKNPKAWNVFLEILKSGNPSVSFGKSRTKYNDNTRKMFEFINDKLVVFLNTKMKMHIPQDFKFYEKDKAAGTGIYKFNFRIGKYNTNSIGAEDLTDDKLMAEIEKCHTKQKKLIHRGDDVAENESEKIKERLIPLLTEAHDRNLITDKEMQTYLNPPEST